MKKTLLIGNGINNLTNNFPWIDLIEYLITSLGIRPFINSSKKPFPLAYEEIFARTLENTDSNENEIKKLIANKLLGTPVNPFYFELFKVNFSDILTTNYDDSISDALCTLGKSKPRSKNIVNENLYSLFRCNEIGSTKLWHIHGTVNDAKSILLGHDHYFSTVTKLRNLVSQGLSYKNIKFTPRLPDLKKNNPINEESWIDIFLNPVPRKIYIVGLTLDFVEHDLWWLLNFRARKYYLKEIMIENEIVYYCPSGYAENGSSRIALLNALKVEVKILNFKSDTIQYYEAILKDIKKK